MQDETELDESERGSLQSHVKLLEDAIRKGCSEKLADKEDLHYLHADKENFSANLVDYVAANTVLSSEGTFPVVDFESELVEPDFVVLVQSVKPERVLKDVVQNLERQAEALVARESLEVLAQVAAQMAEENHSTTEKYNTCRMRKRRLRSSCDDPASSSNSLNSSSSSTTSGKDPLSLSPPVGSVTPPLKSALRRRFHNAPLSAQNYYDTAHVVIPLLQGRLEERKYPRLMHIAVHRSLCERVSAHTALNYEKLRRAYEVDSNTILYHGTFQCALCHADVHNAHNIVAGEACMVQCKAPLLGANGGGARRCCAMVVNGFLNCGVCLADVHHQINFQHMIDRCIQRDRKMLDV